MNNYIRYILVVVLILIISIANGRAQNADKKKTKVRVEYFTDNDKSEKLVAILRVKEKRYLPISDVEVLFYNVNDTSLILIEKVKTNRKGEAIFTFKDEHQLYKDSTGLISFEVKYQGNASNKSAKKKISFKQAAMEISFFQKDTVKYIEINVNEIAINDQLIPIEGMKIHFSVMGTFSNLEFAKEKTDSKGKVIVEFPIDMPGDTIGELTIVSKIDEDDLFGTIESRGEINWGKILEAEKLKHRGLGDTDAPLWMVYTLIFLLSAVWFNYSYVIFLLYKIKRAKRSL